MLRTYLVCIFIGCAVAENCPNVAVKPDFDMNKYTGNWYEIKYHDNHNKGRCLTLNFSLNPNGSFEVVRTQIPTAPDQYPYRKARGTQVEKEKAKLTITDSNGAAKHFWILETDYESFAVAWRCENGVQSAWVLARERQPAQSVLEKAYAAIDKHGISLSYLKVSSQENCN